MNLRKKLVVAFFMTIFIITSMLFPYDLFISLENNMILTTEEFNKLLDD